MCVCVCVCLCACVRASVCMFLCVVCVQHPGMCANACVRVSTCVGTACVLLSIQMLYITLCDMMMIIKESGKFIALF